MSGKHAEHPWRDLGVLKSGMVIIGLALGGMVRFVRAAPEWAVGLLFMGMVIVAFLVWVR